MNFHELSEKAKIRKKARFRKHVTPKILFFFGIVLSFLLCFLTPWVGIPTGIVDVVVFYAWYRSDTKRFHREHQGSFRINGQELVIVHEIISTSRDPKKISVTTEARVQVKFHPPHDPDDIIGYLTDGLKAIAKRMFDGTSEFTQTYNKVVQLRENVREIFTRLESRSQQSDGEIFHVGYKSKLDEPYQSRVRVKASTQRSQREDLIKLSHEDPIVFPTSKNIERTREYVKLQFEKSELLLKRLNQVRKSIHAHLERYRREIIKVDVALRDRLLVLESIRTAELVDQTCIEVDQAIIRVVVDLERSSNFLQEQIHSHLPNAAKRKHLADPNLMTVQELIDLEAAVMEIVKNPPEPNLV